MAKEKENVTSWRRSLMKNTTRYSTEEKAKVKDDTDLLVKEKEDVLTLLDPMDKS